MAIGVEVTTSLRSGPSNVGVQSGRFHVAGLTERGPVDRSVLVQSIAEYENVFGGRAAYTSNLYDAARTFFEEGGSELVVTRVVGDGASIGVLELKDSAAVNTLRVSAKSPGAHSSTVSVATTTTGDTFSLSILLDGVAVQTFRNLASPAAAIDATRQSPYVSLTDLGSASAAPGNNPTTLAAMPLSAGTDDRATVVAADLVASLDRIGPQTEGGAVAIPGYPATVVGAALIAHAAASGKIALLATDVDTTEAEALAQADELVGDVSDRGGIFWPWVTIPDGSGFRDVSPEAYVAGQRARVMTAEGFWVAPPGERSVARFVTGTVVPVDLATNNRLNAGQVNGIVTLVNSRPRIYGWASLAEDRANLGRLSDRDVLNNIGLQVKTVLEPHLFRTVDPRGRLLSSVESSVVGVLAPIAAADGFYRRERGGVVEDPGYKVVVDTTNNTEFTIAQNEIRVAVFVRLSPVAELIRAEIVKVALQAAL